MVLEEPIRKHEVKHEVNVHEDDYEHKEHCEGIHHLYVHLTTNSSYQI